MTNSLLINRSIGETRMALCESGKAVEIRLYRDHKPSYVGAVYLGRVTKLSTEFQAAFVDLGQGVSGFLPLKTLPRTPGKKPKDLTELLHEGQRVIVQVTADANDGKSVKLTGRPELISTAIVFHPFREGAYVSSRIKDPDRRENLKTFGRTLDLKNYGLTFRTDAEHVKNDTLSKIAAYLITHWQNVTKNIKSAKCPGLLTQGPNAVEQVLRECAKSNLDDILIDNAQFIKFAKEWCQNNSPELTSKIKHYQDKENIFNRYEIEDDLEQISSPNISLASGAWITIEATEAMTVIDVNMGDAHHSTDQEKQVFKVNQEAAREIFRQLRLRGIGGIIVIDFINMQNKGQVKSFLHFIDELMFNDPEPMQRGNISSFGLLELTRKASQYNLNQALVRKPRLEKNITSQCLDLIRAIEGQALAEPGIIQNIKVTSEQKKWLENRPELFEQFTQRTGSAIKLEEKNESS